MCARARLRNSKRAAFCLFYFLWTFILVPTRLVLSNEVYKVRIEKREEIKYSIIIIIVIKNEILTTITISFSSKPIGCSKRSLSYRRSLMPTCPSKFNICWTTAGLRVSSLKIQNTPIATATAGLVWTRPSTPTTMTTDIGSCGSCRCTVAKTRAKSSLKSRRASRRSRIATSDALASITSSKSNATLSWCTDQNLAPREKSTTDSCKQLFSLCYVFYSLGFAFSLL